jgi:hypothetical protein
MRNSSCRGFCAGVFLCGSDMGLAVGFLTMTAAHTSLFGVPRGGRRRGRRPNRA